MATGVWMDSVTWEDPAHLPFTRCWADTPLQQPNVCIRMTRSKLGLCVEHRAEVLGEPPPFA